MKLIIVHLPPDAFEPTRTDLVALGVLDITVSQVHRAGPQTATTLRYRGTSLQTNLRAELRLECVTTDAQSPAIIKLLRYRSGITRQVAVLELEEPLQDSPEEHTFPEQRGIEAAIR